jgi:cytochrome c5
LFIIAFHRNNGNKIAKSTSMENFIEHLIKNSFVILCLSFSPYLYADFLDQSAEAIEARIAPIGKVRITLQPAPSQALLAGNTQEHLGKALFANHCVLCHGSGIAGAPRLGNKKDWELRSKKKLSLLLKHVKNGYRAMPPKGACLECSSDNLEAAIHYMLNKVAYPLSKNLYSRQN